MVFVARQSAAREQWLYIWPCEISQTLLGNRALVANRAMSLLVTYTVALHFNCCVCTVVKVLA